MIKLWKERREKYGIIWWFNKESSKVYGKNNWKIFWTCRYCKTKVSIKSAEADLDDQFIELGKLYYEVLNKDNVFDEKAAPVVQKIDEINQRIENLKSSLEKE